MQDPAFGFGQLVDVGAWAPSPAVNDPTTAVQGIDRVGDLVAPVGTRPGPTGLRVDSTGAVRVKRQLRNFEALATPACTEIIRYGADAPQVARRLMAVFDNLEVTSHRTAMPPSPANEAFWPPQSAKPCLLPSPRSQG